MSKSSSSLSGGSFTTSTDLLDSSDETGIIEREVQRRRKDVREDTDRSPRSMKQTQKNTLSPKKSVKTFINSSNTRVKSSKKLAMGSSAGTVCRVAVPSSAASVDEKFEEEKKRSAVENFLASPRRLAVCPVVTPQQDNSPSIPSSPNHPSTPAKLAFSDVTIAAAAAKAMNIKSRDEVAPPTVNEVVERQCRRLLNLAQKGEWDAAMEVIKGLEVMVAEKKVDRTVVADVADKTTGNTPLMYAAIEDRMGMMDRLVALGCAINQRNRENYTALHFASMYAREDTVGWLVARKADPDLRGGSAKQTCVHLASARQSGQSSHVVALLLRHSGKEARLVEIFFGDLINGKNSGWWRTRPTAFLSSRPSKPATVGFAGFS